MLYSIGFFIFSIFYLPILIFKGKLHAEFGERFARFSKAKQKALLLGKDRIWIHAVSVGEVALCKSLVPALKEKFPDHDIVISTITKAGNGLAKKIFSKDVIIIYFPLDFRFIVRKSLNLIKPALYIMVETEIWPNLLREISSRGIHSMLINGRISDRSIGRYRLAKPFLKKILGRIDVYCMQDQIDAARIIELGAPTDKVKVTGNMKFDAEVSANKKDSKVIRDSFGLKEDEYLFVAGSTHEGEEEIVLEVFKKLSGDFPNLKLLIAPRHVNRAEQIEKVVMNSGFQSNRFSAVNESHAPNLTPRILLLDTIGHLNEAYSVAAIVFIGGSLVKRGGHNPIEPACFARPILFGLHMFNFKYITNVFLKNKAAIQISNKEDLYEKCKLLLKDAGASGALGRNAQRCVIEQKGATEKNMAQICRLLI